MAKTGDSGKKRRTELDKLFDDVRGKHAKRMNAVLLTMGEEDSGDIEAFAINFFKLLEYAAPKLQRSEVAVDEIEQKITIEHTYRKKEEDKKQ